MFATNEKSLELMKLSIVKKSVCFISETSKGDRPITVPSVRYRAFHAAASLAELGLRCTVYSAKHFTKVRILTTTFYVFHRPSIARNGFEKTIDLLRKLDRICIADYDDLIFGNQTVAFESAAVKYGTLSPDQAAVSFANNLSAAFCYLTELVCRLSRLRIK